MDAQIFTIANFGHPVSKSWLRLCCSLSLYCPFIDCPLSLYCPFIDCPLSLYCPFIDCPLSLHCPFIDCPPPCLSTVPLLTPPCLSTAPLLTAPYLSIVYLLTAPCHSTAPLLTAPCLSTAPLLTAPLTILLNCFEWNLIIFSLSLTLGATISWLVGAGVLGIYTWVLSNCLANWTPGRTFWSWVQHALPDYLGCQGALEPCPLWRSSLVGPRAANMSAV